jgi:transcriptional regulator with XRE-family HTH domain
VEPLRGPKGSPLTDRQVEGLKQIGAQLRRARLGNGWSQRRLERASGVDQTTISRLENGRLASLRLVRIAALMQAVGGTWQIVEEPPTKLMPRTASRRR